MTVPAGSSPVSPDEREVGFFVGFQRKLFGCLLFLTDSMQLPKDPKQGKSDDHEQ
jgi:hypothetical protein